MYMYVYITILFTLFTLSELYLKTPFDLIYVTSHSVSLGLSAKFHN